MSLLILTIDHEPFVQVVSLDDPDPTYGYDALKATKKYLNPHDAVKAIKKCLDPHDAAHLRWAVVDVVRVADSDPDDVAHMLTRAGHAHTDLPQRWES